MIKMYYATFEYFGAPYEIVGFKTLKERNEWVNYRDKLSLFLGTTKENAPFQRVVLDDNDYVEEMICNPDIQPQTDDDLPNMLIYNVSEGIRRAYDM